MGRNARDKCRHRRPGKLKLHEKATKKRKSMISPFKNLQTVENLAIQNHHVCKKLNKWLKFQELKHWC